MVNPSASVGHPSYAAQQPSVASGGAEAPARSNTVQERSAPAGDSHRGDQKPLGSRDDAPARGTAQSAGSGPRDDTGRGAVVDLSV